MALLLLVLVALLASIYLAVAQQSPQDMDPQLSEEYMRFLEEVNNRLSSNCRTELENVMSDNSLSVSDRCKDEVSRIYQSIQGQGFSQQDGLADDYDSEYYNPDGSMGYRPSEGGAAPGQQQWISAQAAIAILVTGTIGLLGMYYYLHREELMKEETPAKKLSKKKVSLNVCYLCCS